LVAQIELLGMLLSSVAPQSTLVVRACRLAMLGLQSACSYQRRSRFVGITYIDAPPETNEPELAKFGNRVVS
jgi:hypothetical protein